MSKQVLFADTELSVHRLDPADGSRTLLPGQYIDLADLPEYQQEAAKSGKIFGGRIMEKAKADIIQKETAPEVVDLGEEATPETADTGEEVSEVVE